MLKLLIIDDQKEARDNLQLLVLDYCPAVSIVQMATGVQDGVEAINEFEPNIVLLDIEMKDGSGFDLLHHFDEISFQVIFVTGFDTHAFKAIKYSPIDYLLKPVDPKDLIKAINKAKNMLRLSRNNLEFYKDAFSQEFAGKITIPTHTGFEFLKVEDIITVIADGNYSIFNLKDDIKIIASITLKQIEALLPDKRFYRTHRSSIVNIKFVTKFLNRDGGIIIMENNTEISIARRKKEEFLKVMKSPI